MPDTVTREGVTPRDIEAARRHRDELATRHDQQLAAAHDRLAEMRDANDGVLPTDEATVGEVEQLFASADTTGSELDGARAHLARLQSQAYGAQPDDRMPAEEARRRGHTPESTRAAGLPSMAARLIGSEEFRAAREETRGRESGIARIYHRHLAGLQLADADETAGLLSVASARRGGVMAAQFNGDPIVPDDSGRVPSPIEMPVRAPAILDLITIGATELDVIEYTVQTDELGNVTGQPPGTDFLEASVTVERRAAQIVDRGTSLPVPERNLEDEGRIRTFLDGRLRGFLRRDAEAQAVAGDGLGENFTGIENWPGVGVVTRQSGQNIADTIHRQITQVRMAYFDEPNAVALRGDTWETIVLEKDSQGRYVHSAGALSSVPTSLWGKPTVIGHVLAANTTIVGYWPEAELVVRIGVQLREFEQHADFAKKRLVLLRALYRAAFIVNQPVAFSVGDVTTPI